MYLPVSGRVVDDVFLIDSYRTQRINEFDLNGGRWVRAGGRDVFIKSNYFHKY